MADVIVEITEGVFGSKNPLAETDDADAEDTDAEVVIDFFERPRHVLTTGAPDYRPGAVARVGQLGALGMAAINITAAAVALVTGKSFFDGFEEPLPILAGIAQLCRGAAFVLLYRFPGDFVAVIHPETGGLALLGAGRQKVSASKMRALRFWMAVHNLGHLGSFVWFCAMVGMLVWVGLLASEVMHNDFDKDGTLDEATPRQLMPMTAIVTAYMLGSISLFPCCICWALSMKVAAVLAEDSVQEVAKNINPDALNSDESWHTLVSQPCSDLAKKTMWYISGGWGRGIAVGSLAMWLMSFSKLARFLDVIHTEPEYSGAMGFIRVLLPAIGFALGPLVLAMDLATVSSLCDTMISAINDLGFGTNSVQHADEVYRKTRPLLAALKGMHADQGLGLLV